MCPSSPWSGAEAPQRGSSVGPQVPVIAGTAALSLWSHRTTPPWLSRRAGGEVPGDWGWQPRERQGGAQGWSPRGSGAAGTRPEPALGPQQEASPWEPASWPLLLPRPLLREAGAQAAPGTQGTVKAKNSPDPKERRWQDVRTATLRGGKSHSESSRRVTGGPGARRAHRTCGVGGGADSGRRIPGARRHHSPLQRLLGNKNAYKPAQTETRVPDSILSFFFRCKLR